MRVINADELKALIEAESAIVVDVQSEEEYMLEHIPHAVNIPLAILSEYEEELPRDAHIIVYGATAEDAEEAASLLEHEGYSHVAVYPEGITDWEERFEVEGVLE